MSIYQFKTKNGNLVHYGLDKPTGGFFFSEFYKEGEFEEDEDGVANGKDAMTYTELEIELLENYEFKIPPFGTSMMVSEFRSSENPTALQHRIANMFGVNLDERLQRVFSDLQVRFPVEKRGEL